jgi:hypothetical protein
MCSRWMECKVQNCCHSGVISGANARTVFNPSLGNRRILCRHSPSCLILYNSAR